VNNTTGVDNAGTGFYALARNTTGSANTATGSQALAFNTTGFNDTANGRLSLYRNTTGYRNTAVGMNSMNMNTAGNENTAIGMNSLNFNTTGSNNTGLGRAAGRGLTTGSDNVCVGAFTEGVAGESNTIRIGAGVSVTGGAAATPRTFIDRIRGITTGLADAMPVLIDSNGQLGTVSSSRRFKLDIQDMSDASAGLMKLRPVTFRYKQPYADGSQPIQYGLIAEEVAEVYPDLVVRSADGQVETVQYYKIDALLLNEYQKLYRRVEDEAALNASQAAQLAEQQQEIQELRSRLDALAALLERSTPAATATMRP
jgi:hypothetical protein